MFQYSVLVYLLIIFYVEGNYDRFSGEKIKDAVSKEMRVENATE